MSLSYDRPASPESTVLLFETVGPVAILKLNRPEARNAVNKAIAEAMVAALDEFDVRPDLSVAVLTGVGGSFCAGMDLKAYLRGELPRVEGRGFAGLTEQPPKKPLIAAVEGYALAGGFELALACDLIVAADDARFGLPEVKRGLVATGGGLLRLPRQIPYRMAMEFALTGEYLDATKALELGLINRLAPSGQALAVALDFASSVAKNAPLALMATKQVIQQGGDWPADRRWKMQRAIADVAFTSEDAREGATAFAEKRAPVWSGR